MPSGVFDRERAEAAVRELLIAVGEDQTVRACWKPRQGWLARMRKCSLACTPNRRTC